VCEKLDKISVAVLGATGAVGQRFIQLLDGHPWFDLKILAASDKSAGNNYEQVVNWCLTEPLPASAAELQVEKIDSELFKSEGVKLVFSALPSDIAQNIESELAKNAFFVFSNASSHRMDQNVPLLIADINPEHIALIQNQRKNSSGFIVTNPNCSIAGLATGLKPLVTTFGINDVIVTTYQALSGAGYPGVASLDIVDNVLPFIADEEEKVEVECKKILGNLTDSGIDYLNLDVLANCARVPVQDGHLESIVLELKTGTNIDDIKNTLNNYNGLGSRKLPTAPDKPIIVTDAENRPQPKLDIYAGNPKRARGMAVTIGRIKMVKNKLRFYLLVHNTIRGAAGCSIINAELANVEGYLK
jgi:aspartate-semialdehyde dehydrogenase